jgi:hypothetical protein
MVWLSPVAWLTFDSMEDAIYGIVVAVAVVGLILAGYIWYLTPGKHDRLE